MIKSENEWRRFVLRALVLSAMVMVASFVGNRLASARPGVARNAARSFLTVSGTLTGVTGAQTATFSFYNVGAGGTALCSPVEMVAPVGAEGVFSVDVPLDQANVAGEQRRCPDTMFDGSDIYVEVSLASRGVVVARRPINPVPYAHYASVAGQYGTPDCPVGYERLTELVPAGKWFCRGRGGDDVVRVGDGASAFWIDRYEATVWTGRDGPVPGVMTGTARFNSQGDFDRTLFPINGQWRIGWTATPPPMYALSVGGGRYMPARYITWFQAQEACRASGKRLPSGEEWLAAAQGTPDPGDNDGLSSGNNECNTAAVGVRALIPNNACRSAWGAEDMIGNVWEWTSEWLAGLGDGSDSLEQQPWSAQFNSDGTSNISSSAGTNAGTPRGMPAAAFRGGAFNNNMNRAGVFAVNLRYAPSSFHGDVGFRCVIPR